VPLAEHVAVVEQIHLNDLVKHCEIYGGHAHHNDVYRNGRVMCCEIYGIYLDCCQSHVLLETAVSGD
jgi:hypothetical protein